MADNPGPSRTRTPSPARVVEEPERRSRSSEEPGRRPRSSDATRRRSRSSERPRRRSRSSERPRGRSRSPEVPRRPASVGEDEIIIIPDVTRRGRRLSNHSPPRLRRNSRRRRSGGVVRSHGSSSESQSEDEPSPTSRVALSRPVAHRFPSTLTPLAYAEQARPSIAVASRIPPRLAHAYLSDESSSDELSSRRRLRERKVEDYQMEREREREEYRRIEMRKREMEEELKRKEDLEKRKRMEMRLIEEKKRVELKLRREQKAEETEKLIAELTARAKQEREAAASDSKGKGKATSEYPHGPSGSHAMSTGNENPIKLTDAVGRKFTFPWDLAKSWKGVKALIDQAFIHVDFLEHHIMAGHYDLVGPDGSILLPQTWEMLIRPGMEIKQLMWPESKPPPRPGAGHVEIHHAMAPVPPSKKRMPTRLEDFGSPERRVRHHHRHNQRHHSHSPPLVPEAPSWGPGVGIPPPPPPGFALPPPPPGMLPIESPDPRRNVTGGPRRVRTTSTDGTGKKKKHKSSAPPFWLTKADTSHTSRVKSKEARAELVIKGQYYTVLMQLSVHMPHLKNVKLSGCRYRNKTQFFCYDTLKEGGPLSETDTSLSPTHWGTVSDAYDALATLKPSGKNPRSFQKRTIIVEDLSTLTIQALGEVFQLNPEFFEEHLNRSGYHEDSYEDSKPRTWNTSLTPKDYVSIRWFRPVKRSTKNGFPNQPNERRQYLNWDNKLKFRVKTNIFRDEWALVENPDILKRDDSTYSAAWEERATVCRTRTKQGEVVIILLDPLPTFQNPDDDDYDSDDDRPFQQAYSRVALGHELGMAGLFDGKKISRNTIRKVGNFLAGTRGTREDITRWLDEPERHRLFLSSTSESNLLNHLLWVIRCDINGFLFFAGEMLREIGLSATKDYEMRKRLTYWRSQITRLQDELPDLKDGLMVFFEFVHDPEDLHMRKHIDNTIADINVMIKENLKAYDALRADVALLESKHSIRQADSVGKLTELGFIFVPISCVAALFSMQVEPLEGPVPLYGFIVGSIIAVLFAYALRLVIRSSALEDVKVETARKIREKKGIPGADPIPTRVVLSFFFSKSTWMPKRKSMRYVSRRRESRPWARAIGAMAILVCCVGLLMLPVLMVWTRSHLQASFKGMVTLVVFIMVAMFVVVLLQIFGAVPLKLLRGGSSDTTSTVTSSNSSDFYSSPRRSRANKRR